MKNQFLAILAVVALASCSKKPDGPQLNNDNRIVFGSSIEAQTKAIADDAEAFTTNDVIGVMGYLADATGETTNFSTPFMDKVKFTYGADAKFTSNDNNALWKTGKFHNFYAYYPNDLTVTNGTATDAPKVALAVTATSGIAQDVMHAKAVGAVAYSGTAFSEKLAFTHRLSKVKFKITKDAKASATTLQKIEFSMGKNAGSFDVISGAVTGTASAVALSTGVLNQTINGTAQDVTGEWIVLPDDVINDIKVTVDGVVISTTDKSITTAQGKIRVITITLGAGGIEMTSSIQEWGVDDDQNIDA